MNSMHFSQLLQDVAWYHLALVALVVVAARFLVTGVRWTLRHVAEWAPPRLRLSILRIIPVARIVIGAAAVMISVPILIEPTFANVVALAGSLAFALAFTLKDYASSLAGGLTTILENAYQPGDWIEIDGAYGEVTMIANRAVHIVTPDDTEVIIPHMHLWSKTVFNATSGNRSLLCVADFYLDPDHDAEDVRARLVEIGGTSSYRRPDTTVTVIVQEKPWGTHYRLKAYVNESREQFLFVTDLTIRGKAALRKAGIRFAHNRVAVSSGH
ncbi:MAG TPA: mechanosensitive ion channel domain-containing protein [Gemmatimonadaceae bacterium]